MQVANLGAASAYWAKMRPGERAIVCDGVSLDWAHVEELVSSLASTLQAGVSPGDRVGLLLANCLEWPICFLAVLRLGAIVVPLNTRHGSDELCRIEDDAQCRAIIWRPRYCPAFKARFCAEDFSEDTILISPRRSAPAMAAICYEAATGRKVFVEPAAVTADMILGICYTSGTTGMPKGAMLTHGCVQSSIFSVACALQLTSAIRGIVVAPLAYTGTCITNLSPTVMLGGCVFIESDLDPERMLEVICAERINTFGAVPIVWQRLADSPSFATSDITCLSAIWTGGAPVPPGLSKIYYERGVILRETYGCSEFCGIVTCPSAETVLQRPGVTGMPLMGARVRVVNAAGQDCRAGELGEIWLTGPQLMAGYWQNPEANAACWESGWYKTGDLAKVEHDGQFVVVERNKNMIISGGVNIYPAEIEMALQTLDDIEEVAVFGVKDAEWGERVVAVVCSATELRPDHLRKRAKELLGPLKTPREFIVTRERLPRTVSNKISRQSLPGLYTTLTGKQIVAISASVTE
jgi:fatty-acyl-CoA synthase